MRNSKHRYEANPPPKLKTKDKVLTWVAICLFVLGLFLGYSVFTDHENQEVDIITWVRLGFAGVCGLVYFALLIYLRKISMGLEDNKNRLWVGPF